MNQTKMHAAPQVHDSTHRDAYPLLGWVVGRHHSTEIVLGGKSCFLYRTTETKVGFLGLWLGSPPGSEVSVACLSPCASISKTLRGLARELTGGVELRTTAFRGHVRAREMGGLGE